jgi:hypothetical protein
MLLVVVAVMAPPFEVFDELRDREPESSVVHTVVIPEGPTDG